MKEEWKTLGVNTVRGWCNKGKARGWLASNGREQEEEKGKEDRKGVETQPAGIVVLHPTKHVCELLCNIASMR